MNAQRALKNVTDLLTTLERVGVRAWLQDGTLLGLVRDGRLIPWDHDTDTGCLINDWTSEAHEALERAGFTLAKALGTPENGLQHRWVRDGEKTDIFFHYVTGSEQWHAAYEAGSAQWRYTYPLLEFERMTVLGERVWAPSPPELFLAQKYGPDWRTPKQRWHFARDPMNGSKQ
jgi:hypothetical protein